MLFAALSILFLATAATAEVHTVQVGGSGNTPLTYNPSNITAAAGDIVNFIFNVPGTDHSVTQSSFKSPCHNIVGGFASGLIPGTAQTPAQFNITITNSSTPIWYFCSRLQHCPSGMVGAINAPSSGNTYAAFQANAKSDTPSSVQPADNLGASTLGATASLPAGPVATATSTGAPSATSAATGSAASASASASGSSSASAATPSSTSAASHIATSSIVALLAAALGFAMA